MTAPLRIFYDTEFNERGRVYPLELISIGMVDEDGRELYAENALFSEARCNQFVLDNVVPHLDMKHRMLITTIRDEIIDFIGNRTPEFWADYSAYDHVMLAQIFGGMADWPKGWPMWTHDLRQLAEWYGEGWGDPEDSLATGRHHALDDARAVRRLWASMSSMVVR